MLFSVSILISWCRVILKWLEDINSINYWKVCNKHCPLELTNKCPDTILNTLLLLHLKMVTFFFSVVIYNFGGFKAHFLWAFIFLFLIKHVNASYSSCLFLLLQAYNHCHPLVSQSSFPLFTTSNWLCMGVK